MFSKNPNVLIVDDEPSICDLLLEELGERDCKCSAVPDGKAAITKVATQDFDIVLLDIRLPDMSGMEVLNTIQTDHPNTAVIMITGVNNVETAVEAMKLGASDFIVKPFDIDKVYTSIDMASKTKQNSTEKIDHQTRRNVAHESFMGEPTEYMYFVARGVEARLDDIFCISLIINKKTIDIARQLGIPEKEIQKWKAMRSRHDNKRRVVIDSLLRKLRRNRIARSMLDPEVPYGCTPELDELED